MNHDRAKPGLPSRFRTTTVQANKQTVEAETGWLSQRFAPSEKPKPRPEATVPPFSTRFHPPLRRTRHGPFTRVKNNPNFSPHNHLHHFFTTPKVRFCPAPCYFSAGSQEGTPFRGLFHFPNQKRSHYHVASPNGTPRRRALSRQTRPKSRSKILSRRRLNLASGRLRGGSRRIQLRCPTRSRRARAHAETRHLRSQTSRQSRQRPKIDRPADRGRQGRQPVQCRPQRPHRPDHPPAHGRRRSLPKSLRSVPKRVQPRRSPRN